LILRKPLFIATLKNRRNKFMSQFLIAAAVLSSGKDDNLGDLALMLAIIGVPVIAFAALIYWLVKNKPGFPK